MSLKAFGLFWYDFIIGDDWRIALAVVAALIATAALSHAGLSVWWLLPPVVLLVLGVSVLRVARSA